VISWCVFLLLGLTFHVLLLPACAGRVHRGAFAAAYWAVALPMLICGVRMTGSDPIDTLVVQARKERSLAWNATTKTAGGGGASARSHNRHPGAAGELTAAPELYDYPLENESDADREARRCDPSAHMKDGGVERNWCPYCFEHVHTSSKHCRLCDKCVEDFDHRSFKSIHTQP
jgi:hypothetical protein